MCIVDVDPVRRGRDGRRYGSYGRPCDGITRRKRNDLTWDGPEYFERFAILVCAKQHGLERDPPVPRGHYHRPRWIYFLHDHPRSRVSTGIDWYLSLDRATSTSSRGLDITKPSNAIACGVSVTLGQLLAGASGPLLDVFYLRSSLNRYQVVATKAFMQTLGHIVKLVYYGCIASKAVDTLNTLLTPGLLVVSISLAVAGTWVGTRFLDRVNETAFRNVTSKIILIASTICIMKGAWDLLV